MAASAREWMKPLVNQLAGQKIPDSFGRLITAMGEFDSPLLGCKRTWKQHGQSGLWVSDWLPHTAAMADELAVIRSCVADGINHSAGVCQMNTGSVIITLMLGIGAGTVVLSIVTTIVLHPLESAAGADPPDAINKPKERAGPFGPALAQRNLPRAQSTGRRGRAVVARAVLRAFAWRGGLPGTVPEGRARGVRIAAIAEGLAGTIAERGSLAGT